MERRLDGNPLMGVTHKQVARLVRERMSVRGGVRFFTVLSSHRGGGGGWNTCVRYLQSRWISSELQDAAGAGPEPHRHASSWPGGSEESHTHPRLLLRTRGERAFSGGEQSQAELVRSVCVDTHSMVKSLEQAGYSPQQAECLVSLLSRTLSSGLEPLMAAGVTKKDLELLEVRVASEVDSVRSHLVLLEKSTVDTLRSENESLRAQIKKLHEVLKEDVKKVQSGVQLDLNLEKSRLKEESTTLEQQIKDTNNRIQTEVAQLKTQIESQKLESIKYLAGGIFSIVTIVLSLMLGLSRLIK